MRSESERVRRNESVEKLGRTGFNSLLSSFIRNESEPVSLALRILFLGSS